VGGVGAGGGVTAGGGVGVGGGVTAARGVAVGGGEGAVELVCTSVLGWGGRTGGAGIKLKATAATAKLDTPNVTGTACLITAWLVLP